ncbi:MAG: putative lipid II flippase FtsW [Patescibacteria group bacterium]|jgi:cell division protein FtsW
MKSSQSVDGILLSLTLALCVIGIIILASASSVAAFQNLGDPNGYVTKQIISLCLGIAIMLLLARVPYLHWQKWAVPILVVSFLLVVALFIPGVGTSLLGAKRWIAFGGLFFQPSELLKLALILFLARWFTKLGDLEREPQRVFVRLLILIGAIGGMLILQPDLGTSIVIVGIATVLYVAAGAPGRYIALLFAAGVVAIMLLITFEPYRAARLTIFLNPSSSQQDEGYHINQSLLAIGSGGLFGRGYGRSIQKFNYLPEAEGDSIFAIAAEELGFFMVVGLVALYVGFFWRGQQLARRLSDPFGRLIMVGVITWVTLQAFVNIGALSGILPLTGVPLPFISNGGTSLIITLAAIGIALNVSKSVRV